MGKVLADGLHVDEFEKLGGALVLEVMVLRQDRTCDAFRAGKNLS
jgi:hypothetical protein